MYEAIVQSPDPRRLTLFRIAERGRVLDNADVLALWQTDPAFADFFTGLFTLTGYAAFRFETPALSTASLHKPFECVILDAPGASRAPDAETFADFFDAGADPAGVVAFHNLSGDALLIVPSPLVAETDYCGLAEFFRNAPRAQQRALWKVTAREAMRLMSAEPVWLSVAGAGVAWLHVRIDTYPKYYRHDPYRQFA